MMRLECMAHRLDTSIHALLAQLGRLARSMFTWLLVLWSTSQGKKMMIAFHVGVHTIFLTKNWRNPPQPRSPQAGGRWSDRAIVGAISSHNRP